MRPMIAQCARKPFAQGLRRGKFRFHRGVADVYQRHRIGRVRLQDVEQAQMGFGQGEVRRGMVRLPIDRIFQAVDQFILSGKGGILVIMARR